MTDRYENIRRALEMEPTPGAWYLDGEGVQALVRDANGVIVAVRHRMPGHKNETNMRLIAALLAERDALREALTEVLRVNETDAGSDVKVWANAMLNAHAALEQEADRG